METFFDYSLVFKNQKLKRIQLKIDSYPRGIVNSEQDAARVKKKNPQTLEEYLFGPVWGALTKEFGRNFSCIGIQELYLNQLVVLCKTNCSTETIVEILRNLGLEVEILAEEEITGKWGIYRF